jgi:hypothetical protein
MAGKTTEAAATSKSPAKKIATRRKKTEETVVLTWEHVAERAYYISLDAGGDPVENWLQAERELATV